MYNSGCRRIQFGLESYNDRILNLMNKGIQTHAIDKIVKNCLEVGIALNLFIILGFPSETISEMYSAINYALDIVKLSLTNYKIISSVDFSKFQLCKDSPIYKNPIKFGINVIENENKLDLIADYSNKNNNVDNILLDAERKFSNIIYEYFQIDCKNQNIYFDEHYLFLKNCKVTKIAKSSKNIEDIYFKNNKLLNFPTKESNKYYIISYISERFIPNGYYTEKELNGILKTIYSDYVLIRRYLVDYKFINRTKDCTLYWKNTKENGDL